MVRGQWANLAWIFNDHRDLGSHPKDGACCKEFTLLHCLI